MTRSKWHFKSRVAIMVLIGCLSGVALDASFQDSSENVLLTDSGTTETSKYQGLIKRLQENDAYERQRAAIELGNLRDPRAVDPLVAALGDNDQFVRDFAVRSLGEIGSSKAVEPLIRAMQDENLLVRRSAVEALGFIGDSRAVAPLIEATHTGNDLVRRAAVEALGHIGDPRAIQPLIDLLGSEDIFIQEGAAFALSNMGEAARPLLVEALSDWKSGPKIREVLQDLQWQPSSDTEKIWMDVAARNRQSILKNWDTAKNVLISSAESGDDRQTYNAVLALIAIGRDETVGRLVNIMQEKGTVNLMEAFLQCGNNILANAGREWGSRNGVEMEDESRNPAVQWGSMESS